MSTVSLLPIGVECQQQDSRDLRCPQAGVAFVAIEALIDDARRENVFGLPISLNMLVEFGDAFDYSGVVISWAPEAIEHGRDLQQRTEAGFPVLIRPTSDWPTILSALNAPAALLVSRPVDPGCCSEG